MLKGPVLHERCAHKGSMKACVPGSNKMLVAFHSGSGYPDFSRPLPCLSHKLKAGLSVHCKGLEIPGVHLDDVRAAFSGKLKILQIKDFHHSLKAIFFPQFAQGSQGLDVRGLAHDEQKGRRWCCCRCLYLQGIKEKVLAQQGKGLV